MVNGYEHCDIVDRANCDIVDDNHGDVDDIDDDNGDVDDDNSDVDIYIMMQCVCVTKNDHFFLGVSCNHLNHP